jgi:hypothetical protein
MDLLMPALVALTLSKLVATLCSVLVPSGDGPRVPVTNPTYLAQRGSGNDVAVQRSADEIEADGGHVG